MIDEDLSRTVALFVIRVLAGILFFFQGYDKIMRIGLKEVARSLPPAPFGISRNTVYLSVAVSSYIELAGGILLLAGLYKTLAAVFLGLNLLAVSLVFSSIRPMWDMQYVFPRLILVLLILLLPQSWDTWSADYLLNR